MKGLSPENAPELNRRFGERLRELRSQAGMTQAALASAVGLERTSITNIESGAQTVTIPTLVRLCAILNVSPSILVPLEMEEASTSLADIKGQYANLARKILKNALDATG